MAIVTIVAAAAEPDTYVVEMATTFGSLVMYVIVPDTDNNGRELSPAKRVEIACERARAIAVDFLANTPTGPVV